MCGKEFTPTHDQMRAGKHGFFCSKQCSGLYGAKIQNKQITKAQEKILEKTYYYLNKGKTP